MRQHGFSSESSHTNGGNRQVMGNFIAMCCGGKRARCRKILLKEKVKEGFLEKVSSTSILIIIRRVMRVYQCNLYEPLSLVHGSESGLHKHLVLLSLDGEKQLCSGPTLQAGLSQA